MPATGGATPALLAAARYSLTLAGGPARMAFSEGARHMDPWCLVYKEAFASRRDAIRRERQLKAWKSRKAIEELIDRKAITC